MLAETATRGHVLSEEGEARGVGPRSLFSGPAWRVDRFGSEELREWFAEHGRITLAEWRAMTSTGVADVPAAVRVPTVDQVAAVVDGPAELPADVAEPVAAAVVGVEDAEPVCEAAPAPVPQRVRAVVPVDQTAAVAAPVKAPAVPYWVLPAPPPMPVVRGRRRFADLSGPVQVTVVAAGAPVVLLLAWCVFCVRAGAVRWRRSPAGRPAASAAPASMGAACGAPDGARAAAHADVRRKPGVTARGGRLAPSLIGADLAGVADERQELLPEGRRDRAPCAAAGHDAAE